MSRKRLSYNVSFDGPNWPDNPTYHIERFSSINGGDTANTYIFHLFNHYGSHMDAPNHYVKGGIKIAELPFDRFFFEHPYVLDVPKGPGEKVMVADLMPHLDEIAKCDILLFRTGSSKIRFTDPGLFKNNGTAVSAEAAKFLIENYGGTLKCVAVDGLSFACASDTADGTIAHQWMLGAHTENFATIIEDINMEGLDNATLKSVTAMPLMLDGVDSSPVTVWAEIED